MYQSLTKDSVRGELDNPTNLSFKWPTLLSLRNHIDRYLYFKIPIGYKAREDTIHAYIYIYGDSVVYK